MMTPSMKTFKIFRSKIRYVELTYDYTPYYIPYFGVCEREMSCFNFLIPVNLIMIRPIYQVRIDGSMTMSIVFSSSLEISAMNSFESVFKYTKRETVMNGGDFKSIITYKFMIGYSL